jgi:hypothetical protein
MVAPVVRFHRVGLRNKRKQGKEPMKEMTVLIRGVTPILLHNPRMANPLDPFCKALKEVTSKRRKTDEDHAEISWREWLGGLYLDAKRRPCIPAEMLMGCWRSGAKRYKLGKDLSGSVIPNASDFVLLDEAWKTEEQLRHAYESGFADIRSVGNQRARVMRTRPIFRDWSLMVSVTLDEDALNAEDAEKALRAAGQYCGIGDFRPECGGTFGRFLVEEVA